MGWNMSWGKYDSFYLIAYPPENLVDSIISWGYDHIPCDNLFEDINDPSFGREKNIHLTILSNLEETSADKLKTAINNEPTTCCVLGEIKLFKNNSKYDVVLVEVLNKEVKDLHKNISQSIKSSNKFPVYLPHITIAYVKKGLGDQFLNDKYFVGQEFKIVELVLSYNLTDKGAFKLGKS